MKKLMLASEGIDERKVCGTRGGAGPWVLLFQRDCPGGASGPAGIRDPGLGAKVRQNEVCLRPLLQIAPPPRTVT